MSAAMDRALMALSLEEEEEEAPFVMPDRPGFRAIEASALSLIGRALNPECQKMSTLILSMPRKWQKEGKVRGVALSQEKFQFIFNNEHDLLDVLEKGVHTSNEWPVVLERWVENPPEDYLQFIPLWVRIGNIPPEYYTMEALEALGDLIGKVKVVAFDPTKPITQDFVRVQVMFNVAHPLRMSRVVELHGGKSHVIHFNYERLQKRCFTCHRLNHEQKVCPKKVKVRQDEAAARKARIIAEKTKVNQGLSCDDPLFGILEDSQVGLDPNSGRPKIAKEVLDEMRRYMMATSGPDKFIRAERVRETVKEAEKSLLTQKTVLRLEEPPIFTKDLNKGKGIVFDYGKKDKNKEGFDLNVAPEKLMASAIRSAHTPQTLSLPMHLGRVVEEQSESSSASFFSDHSTVYKTGGFVTGTSGVIGKKLTFRRRPSKAVRQAKASKGADSGDLRKMLVERREGKEEAGTRKRTSSTTHRDNSVSNKAKCPKVIPNEGSPKA